MGSVAVRMVAKSSWHVVWGLCLALLPGTVAARDVTVESLHVKDDETQLAKRFAVRESVESPFEYSLGAGYRVDNFSWSIASGGVNVASELNWNKTAITQIRAAGRVNLGRDWFMRGQYATGAVRSGTNRDSDYAGSNRTQEYSRSDNRTGGAVRDISLGLGNRWHLFGGAEGGGLYVSPLVGLSIHQQGLTMYDGQQTVPFTAPLTGLNNSYDAQWKGYWGGLDMLLGLGRSISLSSALEYHLVDYTADANWNLRPDLAHPLSFHHVAKGHGLLWSFGLSYRVTRNFLLSASYERQRWSTKAGYDQTFYSYGTTSVYTLNPVKWDSKALSLSAVYQF